MAELNNTSTDKDTQSLKGIRHTLLLLGYLSIVYKQHAVTESH